MAFLLSFMPRQEIVLVCALPCLVWTRDGAGARGLLHGNRAPPRPPVSSIYERIGAPQSGRLKVAFISFKYLNVKDTAQALP